jgi:opacity protein-like surface antigen
MSERGISVKRGIGMNRAINGKAKSVMIAAVGAALAIGCAHAADLMPVKAPPPPIPFFIVNDTSVSFTYFPSATDPGVAGGSNVVPGGIAGEKNTFARYQGSIDHFDVWEYGTNLIHAEFNQYGSQDPSLGIPGAEGSREFWAIARSTLGFNELSHSKMFSNIITKDISLEVGGNAGVQDNFLDEHTTVGKAGLQFALNLPGVVNVAVMASKEYTRNEFDGCGPGGFGVVNGPAPDIATNTCASGFGMYSGDRDFGTTWTIETFVNEPLTFIPAPVTLQNIANVIGPKGTGISTANCLAVGCFGPTGAFNNNESKTEVFEQVKLVLDTSKLVWGKPGIWDTFIGYRYWYNKFGTNHNAPLFADIAPGTSIESTFLTGMTYHFK